MSYTKVFNLSSRSTTPSRKLQVLTEHTISAGVATARIPRDRRTPLNLFTHTISSTFFSFPLHAAAWLAADSNPSNGPKSRMGGGDLPTLSPLVW